MQFNPIGFAVRTEIKWRPDVVPGKDRKNTLVRTNQLYRPDNQINRPDIQDHRPDASHKKNLKKRGKRAEKYVKNMSQIISRTHVYKIDILV